MKILTADEMRSTDRVTTEHYNVPSLELMEHAGRAVARFVLREFPEALRITALCGKGNNGGDGFVAARILTEAGRKVQLLLLGYPMGATTMGLYALFTRLPQPWRSRSWTRLPESRLS